MPRKNLFISVLLAAWLPLNSLQSESPQTVNRGGTPVEYFKGTKFQKSGKLSARKNGNKRETLRERRLPLFFPAMTTLREDFDSSTFPPAGWAIGNPDPGSNTWDWAAGVSAGSDSGSAWMDFYTYEIDPADVDTLLSPLMTGLVATDSIYFDYAYAEYDDPGFGPDSLRVLVSTNGGVSFSTVFSDGGASLATAPATSLPFEPTLSQWVTKRIGLPAGVTGSQVRIGFLGVNGYGNNLYIDDVIVGNIPANDIEAVVVINPPTGSKQRTSFQPQGLFKNTGTAGQVNVSVRFQILGPTGTLEYNVTSTIPSLPASGTEIATFTSFSVPSTPGFYIARLISQHGGDANSSNDTTQIQFLRPSNLSGTFSVGTGHVLQTLASVAETLATSDVAGPLTFLLTDNVYNEPQPVMFHTEGASSSSPVVLSPSVGNVVALNIQGTEADPYAIGILGSSFFTIDGDNQASTETAPALTINAVGGNGTVGVLVSGLPGEPSSNVTIKNLSIRNGADSTESSTGYYGVLVAGVDSAQRDSAVLISRCDITAHGQAGIAAQNAFGLTVEHCYIHDWNQEAGLTDLRGIWLSSFATNTVLANNIIDRLRNGVNGWWSYGIHCETGAGSNLLCYNSMISRIASEGAGPDQNLAVGIGVSSFLSTGNRFYHNTISLTGNDLSSATSSRFTAMALPSPLPTGLKIRNSILFNTTTSSASGIHSYGLYSAATSWQSGDTSNTNILFAQGAQGAVGYFNGLNRVTLGQWQSATGQDAGSIAGDPGLVASSNLHVASGTSIASNAGSNIPNIPDDIDGEVRSLSVPDIGADEFSSTHLTVTVPLTAGWNLISNPVIRSAGEDSLRLLFPSTLFPYAFSFSNVAGYQQSNVMSVGAGYWGKFSSAGSNYIGGDVLAVDTMDVQSGWNMIGSISYSVDTSTITSVPAGIRSSLWFGYAGGYSASSSVQPGRAYWVKANSAGQFILSGGAAFVSTPAEGTARLHEIVIEDDDGCRQVLYFGEGEESEPIEFFEMPPQLPAEVLDARFVYGGTGFLARFYPRKESVFEEFPLSVRAHGSYFTISWNVNTESVSSTLVYGLSSNNHRDMRGHGSLRLSSEQGDLSVRIRSADTPVTDMPYLLEVYPNPFNPKATIMFSIPQPGKVLIEMFDVLGQKVKTVLQEALPSGNHDVLLDASGSEYPLVSGVFFVRISVNRSGHLEYTSVKKVILLR